MTLFTSRAAGAPGSAARTQQEDRHMSELKLYEVEVNGWATTLQLTDADATKRGLTDEDTVEHRAAVRSWLAAEDVAVARAEADRLAAEEAARITAAAEEAAAISTAAEEATPAPAEATAKARTPANKSRTAANKGA